MSLDATGEIETMFETADVDEAHCGAGAARAETLAARYAGLDGARLLLPLIECEFRGRVTIVSSFGAESAIILALVADIDRDTPVLFIDTGKLFSETLRYRDRLIARLGLRDVRTLVPEPERLAAVDPEESLWLADPDACCAARKVEPLELALHGFDAWVSGRKRYHGGSRAQLPTFESDSAGRIKINPLAGWSRARVEAEFAARGLPRHPLEALGYLSVGCITCTDRVLPGEELRAGRWRGLAKTECGLHWYGSVRLAER
jgi:phosphoadenosine phosphosulfate reductase